MIIMAPKSTARSMTMYKTLCSKRAKAIDDAVNKSVKEHIGKVLGPKQIKHLEYIRAEFEDQNKCMWLAYEKFAIEEHEEIDQAKEIFDEVLAQVETSSDNIQDLIDMAYYGKPVQRTEAIIEILDAED